MSAHAPAASLARLAAISAVLALFALLGGGPAGQAGVPLLPGLPVEPPGARAMGPLPACRYDDILTSPRGYGAWSTTLVDTILRVQKTYAPPDLVRVRDIGVAGRGMVRQVMAADLKAMSDAAAAANAAIGIQSAYRSYEEQRTVFDGWVAVNGYQGALKVSARPGHSEHQLGLAIDVRSEPGGSPFQGDWATTPAGKWMKAHAWEYGFVMSYPKGKIGTTCYAYEPWHYRYVGRELAAKIHAAGLTVREYLWANFTTTVVPPPAPKPTAKPAPTATPASTGTPLPSASATPAPATASPTLPPPSLPPVATPSAAPAAPTASTPTDGPGPIDPVLANPAALAGAGIAIGTIVLGALALVARRGRSGVGL